MTVEEEREKAEQGFTLGTSSGSADAAPGSDRMPKIDFSTFVISLGTSALYHMGIVNEPEQGEAPQKNLALARQTIDTLEMLADKTRGNLGEQESKLMESLLYELRMRFIEVGK
jgi:hypothetical protein